MRLEEEIKSGENCQRRNCQLSIFIIKGGGLKSAMEEHMEQMADLVLFQNLVTSLLGDVEVKRVDLGGGGCCSGDLVMVDLSDQIRFILSGHFFWFQVQLLYVGELILVCGKKYKKVRCHTFIGGCKMGQYTGF